MLLILHKAYHKALKEEHLCEIYGIKLTAILKIISRREFNPANRNLKKNNS
jgi:hypothetical protein